MKTATTMPSTDKDKAKAISDEMATMLCNLWSRWQDEKEYEDWADYDKVIRQAKPLHEYPIIKIGKRPFGVTFALGQFHIQLYVNSRQYGWKRVK